MKCDSKTVLIKMLILLILLELCLQGRSQKSIVYFKSGNNATLICPLNTSNNFILWRNNENIISDGKNMNHMIINYKKYKVSSNESNRSMLQIQMAGKDEIGEYWCETTIDNEFKVWSFRLTKIEMPKHLKIIDTDSENLVRGRENIPVNLTCTVTSGNPKETLAWIFNNTVLVSDNSSDRLSYMIVPDRTFNSRLYTCQADNGYLDSPLQTSISLNIDYIPNVLIIVTPNTTVYEGTSVTFECMHDVNNSTVVNWLKDGKIIPSFKLQLQSVENITRFYAGLYSCRVKGNRQYESENVSLTILYSPKVFVVDYKNGTLFCNASGNPDKYTYAQWEHRSILNNHIRYINGSKDGHLYITDLDSSNGLCYSGIYTCFAENSVLRHDVLYQSGFKHIEFKGLPQCFQDGIFKHGTQSKTTEISIELYSVPQYDNFQWEKLTGLITNISSKYNTAVTRTHFKTVLYGDVSFQVAVWKFSLVIYDLNQDDFDIYTLQVANEEGNTSCSVLLEPTSRGYLTPIVIFMFACGAAISVVLIMIVIQHVVNSRKIARQNMIGKPSTTDNQAIVSYRQRAGQEFTEITLNETDSERTQTIEED